MQPSRGDSLREGSTFPGMRAVGQKNIAYPRGGKITILLLLTSLSLQQNFSQLSPTITEYKMATYVISCYRALTRGGIVSSQSRRKRSLKNSQFHGPHYDFEDATARLCH